MINALYRFHYISTHYHSHVPQGAKQECTKQNINPRAGGIAQLTSVVDVSPSLDGETVLQHELQNEGNGGPAIAPQSFIDPFGVTSTYPKASSSLLASTAASLTRNTCRPRHSMHMQKFSIAQSNAFQQGAEATRKCEDLVLIERHPTFLANGTGTFSYNQKLLLQSSAALCSSSPHSSFDSVRCFL